MCLKFIVYLEQMVPVTDLTSIVLQLQLLFCTVLLVLLPGALEALANAPGLDENSASHTQQQPGRSLYNQ